LIPTCANSRRLLWFGELYVFSLLRSLVVKETGMQYIETVVRYVLSAVEKILKISVNLSILQILSGIVR